MKLFYFWLFFEAFTSLHISCKASIYPAKWWTNDDHRESNPVILCLLRSIGSPELPQKATNIRNLASSRKMRVLRSSQTIQKKNVVAINSLIQDCQIIQMRIVSTFERKKLGCRLLDTSKEQLVQHPEFGFLVQQSSCWEHIKHVQFRLRY